MSNKDNGKLQITVKARKVGNSIVMTIPSDHIERLDIEDGDEMKIQAEEGEYGKYASFWNSSKQAKNSDEK